MKKDGLIHVYTGEGKGKTTAAVGLATRAAGAGKKVVFSQFMKGRDTAELKSLRALGVDVVRQTAPKKFVFQMNDGEKADYSVCQKECFADVCQKAGGCDVLIMDEVVSAITTGMLAEKDVMAFLQQKPEGLEVVLTGRDAPKALRDIADYVTVMQAEKHPYEKGISAREGIEY
ncbi:cob(I)yrinic acid a,c-diamide adenosyltransferase [Clostridia bacterium OttesenSCG-928-O13]|nr:cob(I)yrinic acid a,c-diamide adenosyltransferase [Clostridia bacterium OttesenSCG-928-O13]